MTLRTIAESQVTALIERENCRALFPKGCKAEELMVAAWINGAAQAVGASHAIIAPLRQAE